MGESTVYVGGTLIRRFDGFRRLCRQAAEEYRHPLTVTDGDMILANRTLAGLGGPPAASEVRGTSEGDGLPLLLLFLLTGEIPCHIGLLGNSEPVMARLKALAHLLGHGVYPLVTGKPALGFQEVVRELGAGGAVLRPLLHYDQEGEPTAMDLSGAAGRLGVGPEAGPYTLAVYLGEAAGPAPLARSEGDLHPAVLILP